MVNERKTETIFRSRLRDAGYFADADIVVEEQKSDYPRVAKLLKNASKKGSGPGLPEFIISSRPQSDFLIVVECKGDETKHISTEGNRYSEYAVDGVLLYASYLAKEFVDHHLDLHGGSPLVGRQNPLSVSRIIYNYEALPSRLSFLLLTYCRSRAIETKCSVAKSSLIPS